MKCSYENITSSKEILIKQGIYSQVLESNILQAFINCFLKYEVHNCCAIKFRN